MPQIDLNADLGEGYGIYRVCDDEQILSAITSANIACGFHAGDFSIMDITIKLAKRYRVAIGAHIGYPDLHGFGRREMAMSDNELFCCLIYQIGAFLAMAKANDMQVAHCKPHGALYNKAARDIHTARIICQAIIKTEPRLILLGLAHSCMEKAAQEYGIQYAHEVFADRAYHDDGSLVSRTQENAIIHDSAIVLERIEKMLTEKKVMSIEGNLIDIQADSICVHGDTKEAFIFVQSIRDHLQAKGIQLNALKEHR